MRLKRARRIEAKPCNLNVSKSIWLPPKIKKRSWELRCFVEHRVSPSRRRPVGFVASAGSVNYRWGPGHRIQDLPSGNCLQFANWKITLTKKTTFFSRANAKKLNHQFNNIFFAKVYQRVWLGKNSMLRYSQELPQDANVWPISCAPGDVQTVILGEAPLAPWAFVNPMSLGLEGTSVTDAETWQDELSSDEHSFGPCI